MVKSNLPLIKVKELASLCWVVRDLDKSMESMWNNFGIGPWDIYIRDFNSTLKDESVSNLTYHGKPARFSYQVGMTQEKLGGLEIELLQPIEGDSIYSDFLREHGEGIQHMGWYAVKNMEEFDETIRIMEKAGFPCIQSARMYHTATAYFDTTRVLNIVLQMVWRDSAKFQSRRPNRVFPAHY